ncbi:MAG: hypothetical protein WCZ90_13725 [Melioribacteraceae bacterium]
MIDVKQAVEAAVKYFTDLYAGKHYDLALEEVELNSDETFWLITLGFDTEQKASYTLPMVSAKRKYKIFKVDSKTGKVWSMKIREI